jgi:GGDEF domain-containing protein
VDGQEGQEFLVILPETDSGDAVKVAQKLRCAVSELTTQWGSENIAVTISMGVSGFKHGGTWTNAFNPPIRPSIAQKVGDATGLNAPSNDLPSPFLGLIEQ